MARLAVLASGNGGNFEALVQAIRLRNEEGMPSESRALESRRQRVHDCAVLIYDRKAAFAAERARRLSVPAHYVPYFQRGAEEAESQIAAILKREEADLIALAGFMRILSPAFVSAFRERIVNIHPSLLPAWPGAHAIQRAYEAGALEFGATVHFVDEGMDTGRPIARESFQRGKAESLEEVEARVHEVEHRIYPGAVLSLLDAIDEAKENS